MQTAGQYVVKIVFFISLATLLVVPVTFSGEYEDYLKSQKEAFQSYKDARDGEFIGFLKEQWKEFKIHQGIVRDDKPKPVKMPVAEISVAEKVVPEKSKKVEKVVVPQYKPPVDVVVKPEPQVAKKPVSASIRFYSTPVTIHGDYNFPQPFAGGINKEAITSFWDQMSLLDYDSYLKQVRKFKKELKLNDWGYHHILYRLGMKHYSNDVNMANLFIWYLSSKSGYESRIGYNNDRIYLLMPSRNRLYSIPFLTLKGKKYYSIQFDKQPEKFKSLYTYKGKYPEAENLMDFRILNSPEIKKELRRKTLRFKYEQKNYAVSAVYNKNLVSYYKYYPQTNIKVYFDALISKETQYALVKSLKPLVEGKTEAEAVNTLLRFVQKSFTYKTDDAQFGREKYMFPEETISYPFSDCEDRSFMFAYLVRKLVGLDVIGLDYPGHIATAVKFSNNLPGDYVVINNRKYMVCDPTYVNARLGMAMPRFKNVKPKMVKVSAL